MATERLSPPYFNSGMVFGPCHSFEAMAEPYQDAIIYMRAVMSNSYWFDQLALALALAKTIQRTNLLPMRWNFANQKSFEDIYPDELADVRFIHAMREDVIHRTRDFESDAAVKALVARTDLTGANEQLRAHIAELLNGF